jgi:hypothetical protein
MTRRIIRQIRIGRVRGAAPAVWLEVGEYIVIDSHIGPGRLVQCMGRRRKFHAAVKRLGSNHIGAL